MATTGNQFVASTLHPLRDALLGARFRAFESPEVRRRTSEQHRALLEAIEARDEQRAVSLMLEHMGTTRADILSAREREGSELSENL